MGALNVAADADAPPSSVAGAPVPPTSETDAPLEAKLSRSPCSSTTCRDTGALAATSALKAPRLTAAQPLPGAAIAGAAVNIDAAKPIAMSIAPCAGQAFALFMSIAPQRSYRDSSRCCRAKSTEV